MPREVDATAAFEVKIDAVMEIAGRLENFGRMVRVNEMDTKKLVTLKYYGQPDDPDSDPNTVIEVQFT